MIRDPIKFEAMLAQVRRFLREECLPIEALVDETDAIPEPVVQRMRELGLFGHSIPQEYGGAGLTTEELARVNIEVSQVATAFRARFGGNTGIASESLVVDGTPEQQRKYLPLLRDAARQIEAALQSSQSAIASHAADPFDAGPLPIG